MQYLLSRPDITPDPKDEYGRTPLNEAARGSEAMISAIILDGRADVNAGGMLEYVWCGCWGARQLMSAWSVCLSQAELTHAPVCFPMAASANR